MSKGMKQTVLIAFFFFGVCATSHAHNVGNAITWNREISRLIYQRCASCHREGGTAFSLMTYPEVQPRAVEIKEAVLTRRMPPWGAVKGFGDFRNDQGLTQAELELITDWVDSDTPRGNNRNVLPKEPKFDKPSVFKVPKNAIVASGELKLDREFVLDGVFPSNVPAGGSLKIVAAMPDGEIQPLLWLYEYKDAYQHPFLFREPLTLPPGSTIQGIPSGAKIALLPGKKRKPSSRASR
jgi:mono/diheme cytochrome c family protein